MCAALVSRNYPPITERREIPVSQEEVEVEEGGGTSGFGESFLSSLVPMSRNADSVAISSRRF